MEWSDRWELVDASKNGKEDGDDPDGIDGDEQKVGERDKDEEVNEEEFVFWLKHDERNVEDEEELREIDGDVPIHDDGDDGDGNDWAETGCKKALGDEGDEDNEDGDEQKKRI